jgi:hypothetical protein
MSGFLRQDRDLSRVAEPSTTAIPLNLAQARITPNCHLLRFATAQNTRHSLGLALNSARILWAVVVRPKPEANPVLGSIERTLTKNRALELLERGVSQIQFKAPLANVKFWPDRRFIRGTGRSKLLLSGWNSTRMSSGANSSKMSAGKFYFAKKRSRLASR